MLEETQCCLWNDTKTVRFVTWVLSPILTVKFKSFCGFQNLDTRNILCSELYSWDFLGVWHRRIFLVWGCFQYRKKNNDCFEVRERNVVEQRSLATYQRVHGCHFIRATACSKRLALLFPLKHLWNSDKFFPVY